MNEQSQHPNGIQRFLVETPNGEKYVSYDPNTTLTIVHDFQDGQNLIFKGSEMKAIGNGQLPEELHELDVAVLATDEEIAASSPLKLWNEMRAKQIAQ